jgi:hypothetical protein
MSLADPYLKTSRAKEHLEALRKELKGFYESKPYQFIEKVDSEKGRYYVGIKINETPDSVSLIMGDLLYCLRSSLDQLVWHLARLTIEYPEGTQFPVLEKSDTDSLGRFRKQTTGVPAEAVAIIDSLQPYHAGDRQGIRNHLLWRLNNLCIIDKHRRIPTHGASIDFKLPAEIMSFVSFDNGGIMNIPLAMKSKMKLHPDITFRVVFGDFHEGVDCDLDGVERIYEFVTNDLIPRFARFFK